MACGNLDVKLLELDGRLARLRGDIAWCEGADPDRLRQEAELLRDACARQERALRERMQHSRAGDVVQMAQCYDRIAQEIACVRQAVQDRVLLAEYALDFAVQAADRALLCALEAELAAGAPQE